jgi:hypothetical protein
MIGELRLVSSGHVTLCQVISGYFMLVQVRTL